MVKRGCGSGLYPPDRLSGSGALQAIDLTDPAAAAALEARLVKVLRSGVDGFKIDRGDEVDFELRPVAAGSGDELHNQIPLLLAQTVARASRTARHSLVPTLFRAGFTGAQRHENGVVVRRSVRLVDRARPGDTQRSDGRCGRLFHVGV